MTIKKDSLIEALQNGLTVEELIAILKCNCENCTCKKVDGIYVPVNTEKESVVPTQNEPHNEGDYFDDEYLAEDETDFEVEIALDTAMGRIAEEIAYCRFTTDHDIMRYERLLHVLRLTLDVYEKI